MKRKFTETSLKGGQNLYGEFDFDAFLTSGAPKLTNYCAAIIGSADAEDAAQEAFVRLWKNLYRIQDEKSAHAFLYRTAYRVCIDMIRSRKRFRQPKAPNIVSNTMSATLESALLELSPIDRAILYSRVVDECGYDEIADRFCKNEPWARKRFSLAKNKLKKFLERKKNYE